MTRKIPAVLLCCCVYVALSLAGQAVRCAADESAAQAPDRSGSDERWYQRCLVGMEVGPTGAQFGHSEPTDVKYASRFNGRDIVRRCVDAGSQYLVIWARDGDWAYYDSQVARKCPGLGERDVLREAVEEGRQHHLPIIAYCVVQQGGHFLDDHAQYEMVDMNGQRLGRFCYNSGYLETMKQLLAEQLAYGIDGFHVDMLDQGFGPPYGCWCEHCQKLFQDTYHVPLPRGVTWDEDWARMLEFRCVTSQRFEQALTEHIRQLNPAATVDFNYHGNPPFSFEVGQRPVQHAGNADFVTGETGVWGFSALTVGLNAEFYRAAFPGHPYQVAMQRGVRMYHDQTTRPVHDMRWEMLTLLSHGAFVTLIDKTAYDGSLDSVAYEQMGQVLRDARANKDQFGQSPVYEVGLYFSAATRDFLGRENPAAYFQAFQGAQKACVLEHLPYGVVLDESVSLAALQQFPVVCLSHTAIVSEGEVALLQAYVKQGGNLLITGFAGQCDRYGQYQEATSLSDLIGAKVCGRLESKDNWACFPQRQAEESRAAADLPKVSTLWQDIPCDWPFLVKGPATIYEPTTATPVGQLLEPDRTTRQRKGIDTADWPMSASQVVGPAALVHRVGKGCVVTLAAAADVATASEHAVVAARHLFRNAVRMLHPEPDVQVTAPANVEAVVTDDPEQRMLRVHLLAYNSTPQTTPATNRPYILPGLIEDEPIYRASILVRRGVQHVTTLGTPRALQQDGSRIDLMIEGIHEVVLIKY